MSKTVVPLHAVDEELIPTYATSGAAGADVKANIAKPVIIEPGQMALIPTGVRAEIPQGYEIQVRPRSGLAVKNQITVLNSPGTVDSDYRGELCVILINHGKEPFTVLPKMRIAQIVLAPVVQAEFILKEALTQTARGEAGFGSTGIA